MKQSTKYLKISINILSMVAIFVACVWLLPKVLVFFMPFVIAGIVALIANPLVKFLEQKLKIVRKAGSVVVIVLVLGGVVFACYLLIAKLVNETIGFFSNAQSIWNTISDAALEIRDEYLIFFGRMPLSVQNWLDGIGEGATESMTAWIGGLGEPLADFATRIASNLPLVIIDIIMAVLASYLFVAERDSVDAFIRKIVPKKFADRFELVTSTMKTAVGGYFVAQLKIMVVVYAILIIGFALLEVEYAFLIALLIAILDFLPFFGTGAAMWPWAVVKVVQGDYMTALWIMVIWAISQIVRQLIQPKLVGDSVGLKPIPTLLFLYIGFRFGGAFGMIIAVPVGMILINLYKAGVFSNFVYSIQLLVKDMARLRVFDKEDLKKEGIVVNSPSECDFTEGQNESPNKE